VAARPRSLNRRNRESKDQIADSVGVVQLQRSAGLGETSPGRLPNPSRVFCGRVGNPTRFPKSDFALHHSNVLREASLHYAVQSGKMFVKPVRYQHQKCLHFITFSCYHRLKLLNSDAARISFERELERVRRWYGCFVTGYVIMPEHIHLLISEPERGDLSLAIQMLKQITSRKLRPAALPRFWLVRYYDFPVWTEAKRVEKLRYIHRNPVERGLVARPRRLALEQLCSLRDRQRRLWSRSSHSGRHGSASAWALCRQAGLPTLQQKAREEPALSEVEGAGQPRLGSGT
jgi:putative transposase